MSPPDSDHPASPAKRTPRKAAARGKWSEEQLLTSDKSELITKDLVVRCYFALILDLMGELMICIVSNLEAPSEA